MLRMMLSLLALVTASCTPQYSDFYPYNDDGTLKPNVALVPVIVSTEGVPPQIDLGLYLTDHIRNKLMRDGKIYVPSEEAIERIAEKIPQQQLIMGGDLKPFIAFQPSHYVVVLDLVDHKVVPYKRGTITPIYPSSLHEEQAEVLVMKCRFRMIDLRGGKPTLVRQELVASNHVLPKGTVEAGALDNSSLGVAYQRLASDLAGIIERLTNGAGR